MQWLLVPFGWIFICVVLSTIVVTYLRGRSDLFSAWNFFLLGSANFVGFASVQSGQTTQPYGSHEDWAYLTFIMGATTFFAVLFLTYYGLGRPRDYKVTKTSDVSDVALAGLWVVFALLTVLPFLPYSERITGVTGSTIGLNATIYAICFGTIAVLRRPLNATFWFMLAATTAVAIIVSLLGRGRQPLLNVLLVFPITFYWMRLRYRSPARSFLPLVVGGAVAFVAVSAYGTIRWRASNEPMTVAFAIESLKLLPSELFGARGTSSPLGGDAVEVSLLAIQQFSSWEAVKPFYSIYYVLSNPIPRSYWPGKPESLGTMLPRDLGVWTRTGYVNWGPGIVGHGYHEGGLVMLIFYGFLFGVLLRYFDNKLLAQPQNPIFLAMLCSMAATFLAMPRGDFGIYGMQFFASAFIGWVTLRISSFFLGDVEMPTSHVVASR